MSASASASTARQAPWPGGGDEEVRGLHLHDGLPDRAAREVPARAPGQAGEAGGQARTDARRRAAQLGRGADAAARRRTARRPGGPRAPARPGRRAASRGRCSASSCAPLGVPLSCGQGLRRRCRRRRPRSTGSEAVLGGRRGRLRDRAGRRPGDRGRCRPGARTSSGGPPPAAGGPGRRSTTGRGRAAGPPGDGPGGAGRRPRRRRPRPRSRGRRRRAPAGVARLGPVSRPGRVVLGRGWVLSAGHLGRSGARPRSSRRLPGRSVRAAGSSVTRSAGMSTTAVVRRTGRPGAAAPGRRAGRRAGPPRTDRAGRCWPGRTRAARASWWLASSRTSRRHAQPPVLDLDGVPVRHRPARRRRPGCAGGENDGGVLDQLGEQVDHVADGPAQHAGRLHHADVRPGRSPRPRRPRRGSRRPAAPGCASPDRAPRRRG